MICSASIIEDLVFHCDSNPSTACAYFFFDGRDGQKELQSVGSLIRSLIRQFSASYGGLPAVLAELFRSCHNGGSKPTLKLFHSALITILEAFDDVFIVLDALDECAERKDLLRWIEKMVSWRKSKLHLLATSRLEEDIAKRLRLLDPYHVCMEPDLVTNDVARYIDSILEVEDQWNDEVKAVIKSTLLENAGGMYVRSDVSITLQSDHYFHLLKVSTGVLADQRITRLPYPI